MKQSDFSLLSLPSTKTTRQVVERFPFPIDLIEGNFKDISFTIRDSKMTILHKKIDIKDLSFVWLSSNWTTRDFAYAIRLYLENSKTPHSYVEKGTSKITDCTTFSFNNLPIPNTVVVVKSMISSQLDLIKDVCGFPLIIKDTLGSQGKFSRLANSSKELIEALEELPKTKKFMLQQFIPNDYDWGIMVANGEVVSGEKSYPKKGEFRNNTCNGAKECFVDVSKIPKEVKDIAIKASSSLGLSWSRTDIIIDKNTQKPYLLEVNRYPGITSDSDEANGAFTFLASHIAPEMAHEQKVSI